MGFAIPSETIAVILPQLRDRRQGALELDGPATPAAEGLQQEHLLRRHRGRHRGRDRPGKPRPPRGHPADATASSASTASRSRPSARRTSRPCGGGWACCPSTPRPASSSSAAARPLTLQITPREKGKVEGEELDCPRWDLTLKAINQFDNPDLYFHRKEGVFVYGVKYPGNAANAGLEAQDIVLQIDGKEVVTLEDAKAIYDEAAGQRGHQAPGGVHHPCATG